MGNIVNLAGHKFGKLTYIESIGKGPKGFIWLCQCECGETTETPTNHRFVKKSCGCLGTGRTGEYKTTGLITCKIHGKVSEVVMSHKKWPICRLCWNIERNNKQAKQKRRSVEYAGGCCQLCGYDTYDGALEFHHLDPSKKDFQVNMTLRTWKTIKEEIDKCILLCANCHREVHAGLRSVNDVRNDE